MGCYIFKQPQLKDDPAQQSVINIPTVDMAKVVVGVGNAVDQNSKKFVKVQPSAQPAERLWRRTVFVPTHRHAKKVPTEISVASLSDLAAQSHSYPCTKT